MAPTVVTSDVRDDADFYAGLPVLAGFPQIMDPARYQPLPEGWLIGLTDVEHSTRAIEAGRYQAVNPAGGAVIAAVTSALEGRPFPFVFGGDGAAFCDKQFGRKDGAQLCKNRESGHCG